MSAAGTPFRRPRMLSRTPAGEPKAKDPVCDAEETPWRHATPRPPIVQRAKETQQASTQLVCIASQAAKWLGWSESHSVQRQSRLDDHGGCRFPNHVRPRGIARIQHALEETTKFVAEQHKLMAEQSKLQAEQTKLAAEQVKMTAEAAKLGRDRAQAPWQVALSGMAAGAAFFGAGAAFIKLLGAGQALL